MSKAFPIYSSAGVNFLRIVWIVIRLLLVIWMMQQGNYFYYQGF